MQQTTNKLESLKKLITARSSLDRQLSETRLNQTIARKCANSIQQMALKQRSIELRKDRVEVDRLLYLEATRVNLPKQFAVVLEEGDLKDDKADRVHWVTLDLELGDVAAVKSVALVDLLVA